MRSIMPVRFALLVLVVTTVIALIGNTLRAAPGAGQQPSTGPTTGPTTGPAAADKGPAKPSKNRAWVSGTVLMPDGKPAVGLTIRAEKNEPMSMGGGPQKDTGPAQYPAVTDENGNFLIKEMHINAYLLIAGSQEQGWIYQELIVKPGEETKLGTLKLTKID